MTDIAAFPSAAVRTAAAEVAALPPSLERAMPFEAAVRKLATDGGGIVDQQTVRKAFALDPSALHRAIAAERLVTWIEFGRYRFWYRVEFDELFAAKALALQTEQLQDVVAAIHRERRKRLRFAQLVLAAIPDVGASPEAFQEACASHRLITLDQACHGFDDDAGRASKFSFFRLPYSRGHLENLRAKRAFEIAIMKMRGKLLRIDARDIARVQVAHALINHDSRFPTGSGAGLARVVRPPSLSAPPVQLKRQRAAESRAQPVRSAV